MFGYAPRADWPFGHLEPHAYSLVMIDCAWRFLARSPKGETKSPQAHYKTMTLDEIRALPVADLAAPDCLLWMWATSPMLDEQISIMKDWGFRFRTAGCWTKTTKNGKLAFGTGYILRGNVEFYLIGAIGNPKTASKSIRSGFLAEIREHSRKPDCAYEMARDLVPYGRAADVFSRQTRDGWDSFGDQAGHFDENR
jgi:N6-adenosine-specific RNA methylase IME4